MFSYSLPQPCSDRPMIQGKIPTGLLASCKQVYDEARLIPFHTNTFVFVNWFWSGVYASRQFTRGLKSWQREAMRWPTVEALGRDLWVGAHGAELGVDEVVRKGEWWDLCRMWNGAWGLRLVIKGSAILKGKSLLNTELEWIQDGGLVALHQLRWVELEIEDRSIDREVKLEFCKKLQKVLNEMRSRRDGCDIRVAFVERIKVETPVAEFERLPGRF